MNILITGNLGYIGPVLQSSVRKYFPNALIIGADAGFFRDSVISANAATQAPNLDLQYFCDVRNAYAMEQIIKNHSIGYVIHLAAISNDPMGAEFADVTDHINHQSSVNLAQIALKHNVQSFVFASSCSVYGQGSDKPRTELDTVNPLTAYAQSKILTEYDLERLSSRPDCNTKFTCLRFSTACGYSPRLRLDLVLNDFVATALTTNKINILSDGSPWRPLIDVADMSKLMIWGCIREQGESFEVYNSGAEFCNYQVYDMAAQVSNILPGNIEVYINDNASPDKRSYKVDFSKLNSVVDKEFAPSMTLASTIQKLTSSISSYVGDISPESREHLIRLKVLKNHKVSHRLTEDLYWN